MNLRLVLTLSVLLPLMAACSKPNEAPEATAPAAETAAPAPATPAEPAANSETPAAAAEDTAAAETAAPSAAIAAPSGPAPVPGVDYTAIQNGQPFAPLNGKIEVVEVFGYTCGGCAQFEPVVKSWKRRLPADVRFTPVPAAFGGYWVPYARAYWAAESMGVVDKTHDAMFNAVHVQRSLPVQGVTPEQFGQFYAQHGVDAKAFVSTYNSFGLEAKLSRGKNFAVTSRIESTPTLVVNGKYTVTVGETGGYEKMLNTVEHLIAQERTAQ